jgi:hypothetical protein
MDQDSFRIWWDEELEIVRASAPGVIDENVAQRIWQGTLRMAEEHGDGLDWLIDLSHMTKATSRARKILARASGHPSIRKYAFVGASTFMRTVANFVAAAAGQKNAMHFGTEQEALRWLREERAS